MHVKNNAEVDAYGWIIPTRQRAEGQQWFLSHALRVYYILSRRYHSVRFTCMGLATLER